MAIIWAIQIVEKIHCRKYECATSVPYYNHHCGPPNKWSKPISWPKASTISPFGWAVLHNPSVGTIAYIRIYHASSHPRR